MAHRPSPRALTEFFASNTGLARIGTYDQIKEKLKAAGIGGDLTPTYAMNLVVDEDIKFWAYSEVSVLPIHGRDGIFYILPPETPGATGGEMFIWDEPTKSYLSVGGHIPVDDHLSETSTYPVQNKVITKTLKYKQDGPYRLKDNAYYQLNKILHETVEVNISDFTSPKSSTLTAKDFIVNQTIVYDKNGRMGIVKNVDSSTSKVVVETILLSSSTGDAPIIYQGGYEFINEGQPNEYTVYFRSLGIRSIVPYYWMHFNTIDGTSYNPAMYPEKYIVGSTLLQDRGNIGVLKHIDATNGMLTWEVISSTSAQFQLRSTFSMNSEVGATTEFSWAALESEVDGRGIRQGDFVLDVKGTLGYVLRNSVHGGGSFLTRTISVKGQTIPYWTSQRLSFDHRGSVYINIANLHMADGTMAAPGNVSEGALVVNSDGVLGAITYIDLSNYRVTVSTLVPNFYYPPALRYGGRFDVDTTDSPYNRALLDPNYIYKLDPDYIGEWNRVVDGDMTAEQAYKMLKAGALILDNYGNIGLIHGYDTSTNKIWADIMPEKTPNILYTDQAFRNPSRISTSYQTRGRTHLFTDRRYQKTIKSLYDAEGALVIDPYGRKGFIYGQIFDSGSMVAMITMVESDNLYLKSNILLSKTVGYETGLSLANLQDATDLSASINESDIVPYKTIVTDKDGTMGVYESKWSDGKFYFSTILAGKTEKVPVYYLKQNFRLADPTTEYAFTPESYCKSLEEFHANTSTVTFEEGVAGETLIKDAVGHYGILTKKETTVVGSHLWYVRALSSKTTECLTTPLRTIGDVFLNTTIGGVTRVAPSSLIASTNNQTLSTNDNAGSWNVRNIKPFETIVSDIRGTLGVVSSVEGSDIDIRTFSVVPEQESPIKWYFTNYELTPSTTANQRGDWYYFDATADDHKGHVVTDFTEIQAGDLALHGSGSIVSILEVDTSGTNPFIKVSILSRGQKEVFKYKKSFLQSLNDNKAAEANPYNIYLTFRGRTWFNDCEIKTIQGGSRALEPGDLTRGMLIYDKDGNVAVFDAYSPSSNPSLDTIFLYLISGPGPRLLSLNRTLSGALLQQELVFEGETTYIGRNTGTSIVQQNAAIENFVYGDRLVDTDGNEAFFLNKVDKKLLVALIESQEIPDIDPTKVYVKTYDPNNDEINLVTHDHVESYDVGNYVELLEDDPGAPTHDRIGYITGNVFIDGSDLDHQWTEIQVLDKTISEVDPNGDRLTLPAARFAITRKASSGPTPSAYLPTNPVAWPSGQVITFDDGSKGYKYDIPYTATTNSALQSGVRVLNGSEIPSIDVTVSQLVDAGGNFFIYTNSDIIQESVLWRGDLSGYNVVGNSWSEEIIAHSRDASYSLILWSKYGTPHNAKVYGWVGETRTYQHNVHHYRGSVWVRWVDVPYPGVN